MIRYDEFELESLQVTAFVQRDEISPSSVMRAALREFSELYDGEPISIPVVPGLPSDVPNVWLQSISGRHRLEVSRTRTNAYRLRVDEMALDLTKEMDLIVRQVWELMKGAKTNIGRLAAVATSFSDRDRPAKTVAEHFFIPRWLDAPLNRPQDLEIHSHKVFNLDKGLQVNSWVRIKSAKRISDQSSIVVVEQDINSLEEERLASTFSKQKTEQFFRQVAEEFGVIMSLYFPAESEE